MEGNQVKKPLPEPLVQLIKNTVEKSFRSGLELGTRQGRQKALLEALGVCEGVSFANVEAKLREELARDAKVRL